MTDKKNTVRDEAGTAWAACDNPEELLRLWQEEENLHAAQFLANKYHWVDEEHGIFVDPQKAMAIYEEIGESFEDWDEQEEDDAMKTATFTARGDREELEVIRALYRRLDTDFHLEDEEGRNGIPVGMFIRMLVGSPYYEGIVYPPVATHSAEMHFDAQMKNPHALLCALRQGIPNLEFEMEVHETSDE